MNPHGISANMDCKKTCNVVEYFVKNVTTDLPGRPGREVLNPVKGFS